MINLNITFLVLICLPICHYVGTFFDFFLSHCQQFEFNSQCKDSSALPLTYHYHCTVLLLLLPLLAMSFTTLTVVQLVDLTTLNHMTEGLNPTSAHQLKKADKN
jgi:hypothetical protein